MFPPPSLIIAVLIASCSCVAQLEHELEHS